MDLTEVEREGNHKSVGNENHHKYTGIVFALLASAVGPLSAIIVKGLTDDYDPITLLTWRFVGMLLPSILVAIFHQYWRKDDIFQRLNEPGKWKISTFLLLRAIGGSFALFLQFHALQYMTVGDCKAITCSTPFIVLLIAHFSLGEKCGVVPTFAGLCSLMGVFVIARPPFLTGEEAFDTNILQGTFLAIGVLLCTTTSHVLLRHLKSVHYTVPTLCFTIFGTVVTISVAFVTGKLEVPKTWTHFWLAVGMSVVAVIGQDLQNLAFEYEDASVISLVRSSSVVFSFWWQWVFLSVIPDKFSAIGAILVIFAIFTVGLRKIVGSKSPENRSFFSWILY